jgi:hypothetical protein
MSLDISLIENITDKLIEWNNRRIASLNEAGSMIGLIPIIEEYYEGYKPNKHHILYSDNITHNLNTMANKADIYYYLWRPEEINITYAHELIKPLTKGLTDLKNKPDYYKKFNASNGWGLYEHFIPFVENYLNACIKYPDSIIEISR